MIIISHSRSKTNPFKVKSIGRNGEILKSSETLSTKKNCFKNILADLTENYSGCLGVHIGDATTDNKVHYFTVEELKKKAGKI